MRRRSATRSAKRLSGRGTAGRRTAERYPADPDGPVHNGCKGGAHGARARGAPTRATPPEGGDADERQAHECLAGSPAAVLARREACHDRRASAVHALLQKIVPMKGKAPVDAAFVRGERQRLMASGGIVKKTAAKVASDAKSFQL